MLYFSELLNRKVVTEENVYVGKLVDLIFKLSETAEIAKAVVKTKLDPKTIVDISDVVKINGSITLKKNYHTRDL
ncbi:MAG: PRC-barrel domain-containing protein, partial [Microgenomates group bacterium]